MTLAVGRSTQIVLRPTLRAADFPFDEPKRLQPRLIGHFALYHRSNISN
jgi:hypothetical protein